MTAPVRKSGKLRARLDIPSYQLQHHLPIEVRNSRLALIRELKHMEDVDLPPGWYEVSAVLDDGRRHSETIQIAAGDSKNITLGISPEKLLATSTMVDGGSRQDVDEVQFGEATEANLAEQTPERWIFHPVNREPKSVPVCRLRIGGAAISVSLPVNPRGSSDLAACIMTFNRDSSGIHVRAGFHPDRIVSAAIQMMVDKGEFAHATAAAEQTAEDMLQSKYSDPVGAALGAIIMYRAGSLAGRGAWLRNLQRDFDWLPDGKILLAALSGAAEQEVATELLLRASEQRPMFTGSFSVLFDTLRRWPSTHRSDETSEAFRRVAAIAKRVDWSAFTLTLRES